MARKRKALAKRHPNGHIVRERGESTRMVASRMPHRRGLGDHALDQRAECELGRLALRGRITDDQALAGQHFAQDYGAYLATIAPPSRLGGHGRAFDCEGCLGAIRPEFCMCEHRAGVYMASLASLASAGPIAIEMIVCVVLQDRPCLPPFVKYLALGLDALACHYGLTNPRKGRYQNAKSHIAARPRTN